ncbi:MAG: NADH-quinone oxidoreductase subunit C [Calditrichia bacterium]
MLDNAKIKQDLEKKFPEVSFEEFKGMLTVIIQKKDIIPVLKYLKTHKQFKFDYLTDVTAVDYLDMEKEPRFAMVYHLQSLDNDFRIRVRALVEEDDVEVDTVSSLWKGAIWLEREVFDMFGIIFKGHPDLRRILTPDNFDGHPLRKDYPLRGKGERDILLDLK